MDILKSNAVIVILTLLGRREMHGYELLKSIEKESKGVFAYKEGTLYPLLHQLEEQKAVSARWEQTDSARKRRYYRLTPRGRKLLEEKKRQWVTFQKAMEQFV